MTIGLVALQVALKLLKVLCNFYISEKEFKKNMLEWAQLKGE